MRRKRASAKRTHTQKKSKDASLHKYLYWYFFSIAITLFVTSLFTLFPSNKLSSQKITCANSISCIKDLSVNVENNAKGFFEGHKITPPKINLAEGNLQQAVLGASVTPGPKHIYVNLTNQTLTAYQGSTIILKTLISSGKWNPTPDGTFSIWLKLRATRMTGGSGADFYDLPNVPYVMYFYNNQVPKSEGFGLHGAYWHDNFGHTMSHGCINMRTVDAQSLYNWVDPQTSGDQTFATSADPGTKITISGTPTD